MENESKLLQFAAKKKQFDDDGPLHMQEADIGADGRVVLCFWVNAHCLPDIMRMPMGEFLEKPLDELPHWECNELGDWYIGHCQGYEATRGA